MKALKKIKTDLWINAIVTVLIGILFIITPHDSLKVIAVIAGILILCSGIFDLIYDRRVWWDDYFTHGILFEGILKCILGIFIFTHASTTTILFSYIFSICIIINGVICMEAAIYMKKIFSIPCGLSVVLSCLIILAGIYMMFLSPDTVSSVALMVGIIFIANGIIDMIILYQLRKAGNKYALEMKDVIDEINGDIIDE